MSTTKEVVAVMQMIFGLYLEIVLDPLPNVCV